jgi:hypothetical protein
MENEFISYQQALELKELGFDEPCLGIHYNEGLNPSFMVASQYGEHGATANGGILAPLYQQAFRWFRKKYELYSFVFKFDEGFGYETYKEGVTQTNESFETYEEAELACLIKLIEITKTK